MTSSVHEAGGVFWENRQVEYIAEQALGYSPSPSEVSAYWYDRAWEFIRGEPLAFLRLLVKKFYLFWTHFEIANNLSYYWFERSSLVLKMLPVGFWLVGPLGLAGAAVAWKEPKARLPILFLLLYCTVTIAFFVTDRFRLPVVPVLCIFAGYVVHKTSVYLMMRHWRSLVGSGTFIAAGALLVNTNFASLRSDVGLGEEGMKARAAIESGNFVKAAELLERVVLLEPGNSGAHINRGIALWKLGKTQEAADAFRAGIKGDPYLASINLAHLYYTNSLMDSVGTHAHRAVKERPFAPGGYIIGAKMFLVQQKIRQAEETLLAGLANCRDDFVYGEYLLAGIYFHNGNVVAADSMYRRVLARTLQLKQPRYSIGSEEVQFGEDLPTLHAKTLHALGRVFAVHQRLDSSEAYLRSAAYLLPTKPDVWADWGVCLLRMNRLGEADTVMRRAVILDANNPTIWFNYATVLARNAEFEGAKQAVSMALALKPDFDEARHLSRILSRANIKKK